MSQRLPWIAALLLVGLWLGSGIMVVDTGQKALVYRFGAVDRVQGAGLHARLPWPVESDDRINVTEVRRVEPGPRRMLTSDTNLVLLSLAVQYTVADPVAFTLRVEDPERAIAAMVLGAATAGAASMDVDDLLTTGRGGLERQILSAGQRAVDSAGLGARLVAVDVRELAPPGPVVDAFNDVSSARGDRETLALSAEAYSSKLLPDMRGQAAEMKESARAAAAVRLATVRAETARFQQLRAVWRRDREGTRVELHAELLAEVAPQLELLVVPTGTEIVLPPNGRP